MKRENEDVRREGRSGKKAPEKVKAWETQTLSKDEGVKGGGLVFQAGEKAKP